MMKEITDEDEVKINNTKWCISIYAWTETCKADESPVET